jgi:hypothetical protein
LDNCGISYPSKVFPAELKRLVEKPVANHVKSGRISLAQACIRLE